ncbi:hypothetical protein HPB52_015910 [Rhipicephalus sanguineus]|uniref:Uncharacterized protein n=1 Tax=Rhipicephalus sanguineus TaxID=34632 RepID=A0A9D4QGV9_RHISA|nr:hypothetical protein HPB52_015910 [Rhipicephalus sanguineus]
MRSMRSMRFRLSGVSRGMEVAVSGVEVASPSLERCRRRLDSQCGKAFGVIREYHPGLGNPAGIPVSGKCRDTFVYGKLPSFSTANGYVYLGCPKVY